MHTERERIIVGGFFPQQISVWNLAVNLKHRLFVQLLQIIWRWMTVALEDLQFYVLVTPVWENKTSENRDKKKFDARLLVHPLPSLCFVRQSRWGYIWLTTDSGGNDPPQKNQWQNMVLPATESSTYKRLGFGAPIDISSLWYFDMEIKPSSLCFLRYLSLTWVKLKLRV